MMCTSNTLTLTLKGIPPLPPFYDKSLWDRWLDRWSMNCALVLRSMVPALVHKLVSWCNTTECCEWNIRGLVLGFGYKKYKFIHSFILWRLIPRLGKSKKYKWEWRCMPLKCRRSALGLVQLCDFRIVKWWALEGASLADSLGRGGGGCTHTQDSSVYVAMC